MERKIGEIFEHNGEWYQCVSDTTDDNCNNCFFQKHCSNITGSCSSTTRSDGKSVAFKKLEKVEEPWEFQKRTIQTYKLYTEPFISVGMMDFIWDYNYLYGSNTIDIIIKQTKEDMEEKKLKISFEKADYLINKLQEILADYLHGGESDEVIAKFERLLDIEKNLREFDFEAAKQGKPICTRDGRKARIICFDKQEGLPIVALVETKVNGRISEEIALFYIDGRAVSADIDSKLDLMMISEKRSGWAKIRKDVNLYNTKEEADRKMIGNYEYVTAKVCWEE